MLGPAEKWHVVGLLQVKGDTPERVAPEQLVGALAKLGYHHSAPSCQLRDVVDGDANWIGYGLVLVMHEPRQEVDHVFCGNVDLVMLRVVELRHTASVFVLTSVGGGILVANGERLNALVGGLQAEESGVGRRINAA